jgi:Fe-Mn family superoxide dismutase
MKMFKLPELPYSFDALEPDIDAKTMELHYTKHHQGYVDKLNKALEGTKFSGMDIIKLLKNIDKIPKEKRQAVINNGGGHANHSLFWELLSPKPTTPSGNIAEAINAKFGSFEDFRKEFTDAAISVFGSGWAWLIVNSKGELEILSTPNQNSPVLENKTPILGIDVWEHAYYLKYQNRRPDYITAFFNIINWDKVEELFNSTRR